jgi:O-antigen/teichoic acid export membrane protein
MRVIANAFWLSFCRVAADVLSFVLFAAISRAFGPTGTGQYSYGFAVATLVALIATSGFEDYGIRQYARAGTQERARLWEDLLTTQCAQLALGVLVFLTFALAGAIHASSKIVILELLIYIVGWWISRTFFIPAMAAQSMVRPAVTDLTCRTAAIMFALVALSAKASLPIILAGFPIAGVALAALSLTSASRHGARLQTVRSWRRIIYTLRGTLPFAGSDLLNQFYARADVLLIAYFLGDASVGLYATGIKFVEVGLLPLILLGTAAYPVLSAHAARSELTFARAGRDFTRLLFLLTGWLAVGIYCVVPLLVVPLFGASFAATVALLPWIALFAVTKGFEATFYRLLYSAQRQALYFLSLLAGTVLIIALNFRLIPSLGLKGAILAAIVSTVVVDSLSVIGLLPRIGRVFLATAVIRVGLALAITWALVVEMRKLDLNPWITACAACTVFPALGACLGLLPHPRRSQLLEQLETGDTAPP